VVPGEWSKPTRHLAAVPPAAAMSHGNTHAADRLALAELELARVEVACRWSGCGSDCYVRAAILKSVESERAELERVSVAEVAA
jgi:hypothetical protein